MSLNYSEYFNKQYSYISSSFYLLGVIWKMTQAWSEHIDWSLILYWVLNIYSANFVIYYLVFSLSIISLIQWNFFLNFKLSGYDADHFETSSLAGLTTFLSSYFDHDDRTYPSSTGAYHFYRTNWCYHLGYATFITRVS